MKKKHFERIRHGIRYGIRAGIRWAIVAVGIQLGMQLGWVTAARGQSVGVIWGMAQDLGHELVPAPTSPAPDLPHAIAPGLVLGVTDEVQTAEPESIAVGLRLGLPRIRSDALYGVGVNLFSGIEDTAFGGVEISGFYNVSDGTAAGLRIAALANVDRGDFAGVEIAVCNMAGHANGLQVGICNLAERVCGVQIGLCNIASRLYGVQIGLFNCVDDQPFCLPILNIGF